MQEHKSKQISGHVYLSAKNVESKYELSNVSEPNEMTSF
jgi:hypothetical protein